MKKLKSCNHKFGISTRARACTPQRLSDCSGSQNTLRGGPRRESPGRLRSNGLLEYSLSRLEMVSCDIIFTSWSYPGSPSLGFAPRPWYRELIMILLLILFQIIIMSLFTGFEVSFRYERNNNEKDHCRNPNHRQVEIKMWLKCLKLLSLRVTCNKSINIKAGFHLTLLPPPL